LKKFITIIIYTLSITAISNTSFAAEQSISIEALILDCEEYMEGGSIKKFNISSANSEENLSNYGLSVLWTDTHKAGVYDLAFSMSVENMFSQLLSHFHAEKRIIFTFK